MLNKIRQTKPQVCLIQNFGLQKGSSARAAKQILFGVSNC